jgi:hypothetical protein
MEKKELSRENFKQICSEALKHSTGWIDYVHKVRVKLRSWLGDKDPRGPVPAPYINPPTTEQEKLQAELDILTTFFQGRCNFAFFPGEVLTEVAVEARKNWAKSDYSSNSADESKLF